MTTDLRPVKRAAAKKRAALEQYRRAVVEASEEGSSHADIARAAGVSRQAVRVIVERASRGQTTMYGCAICLQPVSVSGRARGGRLEHECPEHGWVSDIVPLTGEEQ